MDIAKWSVSLNTGILFGAMLSNAAQAVKDFKECSKDQK
jgi:hypothetical protein